MDTTHRRQQKLRSLYRLRAGLRKRCYEFFDKIGCNECGIDDILVLEFDHVDRSTKLYNIALMINSRMSWDLIEAELKKCQLLCANCHKKKTMKESKAWEYMVLLELKSVH